MNRRELGFYGCGVGLLVTVLALTACNPNTVSGNMTIANTSLDIAEADARKVVTFYGIAKGIETVACPDVVTTETCTDARLIVAKVDPLIYKLYAALAVVNGDAAEIEALVAEVNAEAVLLENQTAAGIKVVKNAS